MSCAETDNYNVVRIILKRVYFLISFNPTVESAIHLCYLQPFVVYSSRGNYGNQDVNCHSVFSIFDEVLSNGRVRPRISRFFLRCSRRWIEKITENGFVQVLGKWLGFNSFSLTAMSVPQRTLQISNDVYLYRLHFGKRNLKFCGETLESESGIVNIYSDVYWCAISVNTSEIYAIIRFDVATVWNIQCRRGIVKMASHGQSQYFCS